MKCRWKLTEPVMWVLNIAMFIILLAMFARCASAPILAVEIDSNGKTLCGLNNRPLILINEKLIGKDEWRFVLYHEQTHVQQMGRNCTKFMQKYKYDKNFRIKTELQAYCIERRMRMEYGQDGEVLMQGIKRVFADIYKADTLGMVCRPP